MKKLKLDLTELSVESFSAAPAPAMRGTVKGYLTDVGYSCDPQYASCGPQTCGIHYCALDTENPDCSGGTTGTLAGDSCDECLTIWTDSPMDCPCY